MPSRFHSAVTLVLKRDAMRIVTSTDTPTDRPTAHAPTRAPGTGTAGRIVEQAVELRASWQEAAMCRGKTDIFFAPPGERRGRRSRREALARAYCACCSVAEQCREAGRAGREHGLWGGENDEQRAAAGHGPRSPHRRAVAVAARRARRAHAHDEQDETETGMAESEVA